MAERVAAEGMRLVLGDIEEGALREAERALGERGAEVLGVVTDVSDAASVRELRDRALDRFGAVHLVHNNAGVGLGGPIWEVTEEDWRWILDVNLWGVVHGVHTFVPLLIEQGEGHVVNTASIAGLVASPFLGPYNATKQAVVGISETLFKDLQMAGSPVGVSVLCPGFVQTRIDESERNRPDWAPAQEGEAADGLRGVIRALIVGGHPGVGGGRRRGRRREDQHLLHPHPSRDGCCGADAFRRHRPAAAAQPLPDRLSNRRAGSSGGCLTPTWWTASAARTRWSRWSSMTSWAMA